MTIDFMFSGLAIKLWLNFSRAFLLVYGLLTLLFSCKTGLTESPNNGNNNSGTNDGFSNAVKKIHDFFV